MLIRYFILLHQTGKINLYREIVQNQNMSHNLSFTSFTMLQNFCPSLLTFIAESLARHQVEKPKLVKNRLSSGKEQHRKMQNISTLGTLNCSSS